MLHLLAVYDRQLPTYSFDDQITRTEQRFFNGIVTR